MTRQRDIHKIDNYLVRFGWLFLAWGLLATGCSATMTDYQLEHPGGRSERMRSNDDIAVVRRIHPGADVTALGSGPRAIWLWMLAASALMLGSGYAVRRAESRALAVWDILDHVVEVPADELAASTGLTREKLRRTLALINAQPGTYYIWEPTSDMIVDGRLRRRVVHVDRCESCGAKVSFSVTLDLARVPACDYCAGPVVAARDTLLEMREATLREIRGGESAQDRGFSVALFVVLLIVFWPAAVGYALWKSGVLETLITEVKGALGRA